MNQIPITKDTYWSDIESEDLKVGSKIKVIGYPGEYKGELYSMDGTIKSIVEKKNGHKIILYDDLDTTPG
jgi:hypothetical protein